MGKVTLGPISEGTLRPQDLIPAMLEELRQLNSTAYAQFTMDGQIPPAYADEDDESEWWQSEDAQHIMDALTEELQDEAPDYVCFGPHPGDGACIGFWPDWDRINMDRMDGELPDTIAVPDNYAGAAIEVNDHGNVTLFIHDGNGNREILWDCV